ncbi:hypothetical protein ACQKKE_00940 [Desemzia incerta]|uniref:hypothetical protein n=1 Tax=Desemzia incerta TaxID=82801 RepID=UPI003D07A183
MKMTPFMKDERYVKIVKEYLEAMETIKKQKKRDVKSERINEDVKAASSKLLSQLNSYYIEKKSEVQTEKKRIETSYKNNKKTYEDPLTEQLNRQDFEMEVKVMKDPELQDLLTKSGRDLSTYEVNRVHAELKNRGLNETPALVYKRNSKIGKEYENDANYQKLAQEDEYLMLISPRGNATSIYFPTESGLSMETITSLERAKHNKIYQIEDTIKKVNFGLKAMESNIQSQNDWLRSISGTIEKEKEEYAAEMEKKGKKVNYEYQDDDPRVNRGNPEFDIVSQFKYLKERYHEPDNFMYSIANPDYDTQKHLNYMLAKHEKTVALKQKNDDTNKKTSFDKNQTQEVTTEIS